MTGLTRWRYAVPSPEGRAPGKGRCCSCLSLLVQRKAHKERTSPQTPAEACARNSPDRVPRIRLRQARASDVLPDDICIFGVASTALVGTAAPCFVMGLPESRLKTRAPRSNILEAKRLRMATVRHMFHSSWPLADGKSSAAQRARAEWYGITWSLRSTWFALRRRRVKI